MYNIVPVLNIYTHFLYCSLTVLKQTQPLVISVSYKNQSEWCYIVHNEPLFSLYTKCFSSIKSSNKLNFTNELPRFVH